jgi:hypothetical protein
MLITVFLSEYLILLLIKLSITWAILFLSQISKGKFGSKSVIIEILFFPT